MHPRLLAARPSARVPVECSPAEHGPQNAPPNATHAVHCSIASSFLHCPHSLGAMAAPPIACAGVDGAPMCAAPIACGVGGAESIAAGVAASLPGAGEIASLIGAAHYRTCTERHARDRADSRCDDADAHSSAASNLRLLVLTLFSSWPPRSCRYVGMCALVDRAIPLCRAKHQRRDNGRRPSTRSTRDDTERGEAPQ
jgi:hypothetical protein